MSFFDPFRREQDEGLGPPPPPFRIGGRAQRFWGWRRWLALGAILIVLITLANLARGFYTDWLWFDSLGYVSVFSKEIVTRLWLFGAAASIALVFIGANILAAVRFSPQGEARSLFADIDPEALRRITTIGLVTGTLFLAVIFGAVASGQWE